MEKLTPEEKKANLAEYKKTIHPPRPGEPMVPVRVMHPGGYWHCPPETPNMGKKYLEGEELLVPEHIWLNSDYHAPRLSLSGMMLRGVFERTDQHAAKGEVGRAANDDAKALAKRVQELERQLLIATGRPASETPLVAIDKSEEI
jgi:hypothetical protein